MTAALILLLIQGFLGAMDTLYYHEYRARLPAGGLHTRPELLLHGARDLIYALFFFVLPFWAPHGVLAVGLGVLLLAEIVITLADFTIEDRVRAPLGGVFPMERVMHTVMAIVYGAALAYLVPELLAFARQPTGLVPHAPVPAPVAWAMVGLGLGVLLSGIRDLACASGFRAAAAPWHRTANPWEGNR